MAQKILIIDSSSMIAMRLKVLLELIGCEVELVHYSMFDKSSNIDAVSYTHLTLPTSDLV